MPNKIKKYLVFELQSQQFAVALHDVREVIGMPQIVPVPGAPNYFLGLINLRGRVLTAIDLKKKIYDLELLEKANTVKRPVVIVTEIDQVPLGCMVDRIVEVLAIPEAKIERQLDVKLASREKFCSGIIRLEGREMILVMDFNHSMDLSELVKMKELAV